MSIPLRHFALILAVFFALLVVGAGTGTAEVRLVPGGGETGQNETVAGEVPGNTLGNDSDAEMWRAVRDGTFGTVAIPDKKAARLIQSEGENWRVVRNGELSYYGIWAIIGVIGLLALFFLIRGRIEIEGGRDGRTITRFGFLDRMGHWLLATSFILLALTGLNILYGRYVLLPVIGPEAFGAITWWGKHVHNYFAFAFMVGLATILLLWIADNIPRRVDLKWLAKGGGMFRKGGHASAYKFNAGQKILFWLVILFGISVSLSGIALLLPFELSLFGKTFAFLNIFGFDLPTDLTVVQEMQLSQLWHAIVALFLTALIIAHIYIGTIGMQGGFDAMGTGRVDLNWAREHHDLWAEEKLAEDQAVRGPASVQPAE